MYKPENTIDKSKIRDIKYLINKIEKQYSELNIPKHALLIGAGCSAKCGIPLGGQIVTLCKLHSFIENRISGSKEFLKGCADPYDIQQLTALLEKKEEQDNYEKYLTEKEEELKERLNADRDVYIKRIQKIFGEEAAQLSDVDTTQVWANFENAAIADNQYGFWMDQYSEDPIDRQNFVEKIIDNKQPNGAYILLAYLIEKQVFTNLLTTNFDDLINEALIYYTESRCRFYADDEISQYINIHSKKPNIIKIHGDYRYANIKNTNEETGKLSNNVGIKLEELLSKLGLIVVGYNGADHSIMSVLYEIKKSCKYPLIWCGQNPDSVHWRVAQLINKTPNSFFVQIEGFDEMIGQMVPNFFKYGIKRNLEEKAKKRQVVIDNYIVKFAKDIENSDITQEEKENFEKTLTKSELFNKAYDSNDPKEKVNLYTQIISLDGNNTMVYNNRGNAYADLKQYDNAIKDYMQAIKLDENNAMVYNNRGNVYRVLKQYDKALENFNKTIALDRNYVSGYNNRGVAYSDLKQYDKAIEDYNQAIILDPQNIDAYNNRGVAYKDLKQYDKAIEDFNQAIALNGKYADIYNNRGIIHKALKQYDKAIEDYNQAITLDKNFADAYYNLGKVYSDLKQHDKAIEQYNHYKDINGEDAEYYNSVADTYRVIGNLITALEYAQKGIEKFPTDAFLTGTLAEIYAQMNNEEKFYEYIEQAMQLGLIVSDFLNDPVYEPYKNEERFKALLKKYNLPLP